MSASTEPSGMALPRLPCGRCDGNGWLVEVNSDPWYDRRPYYRAKDVESFGVVACYSCWETGAYEHHVREA